MLRVHAGVVELDALADPVGPRAEDDHRLPLARRDLGLLVVGGVVVRRPRGELGGAGVDGLVDRADAERVPDAADDVLAACRACRPIWASEKPCRLASRSSGGVSSAASMTSCGDLVDQAQLVDEPRVDARSPRGPPPGSRRRGARPSPRAAGRRAACGSPSSSASLSRLDRGGGSSRTTRLLVLQRAQRLLQRLGEVAADRHRLADATSCAWSASGRRPGTSRTRTAAP